MAIYSGFTHEKWWFSIVMWLFTRGYLPECRKPMKTISPWKWSPLSESLPYLSPTCVSIWKSCGRDWKSWTIGKTCPGDPGWRWGFLDKKNMMKRWWKSPWYPMTIIKNPGIPLGIVFDPQSQSSTGLSEAETRPAKRPDPDRPRSSQRRPRLEIRHVPPKDASRSCWIQMDRIRNRGSWREYLIYILTLGGSDS